MSLIKCIECGKKISEYADKCPNCGCQVEISKHDKYTATLTNGGKSKIKVISKLRELLKLDLSQAKNIVDNCKIIKSNISLQEAEYIKKEVEALGGQVEITPYTKVQDTQINTSLPKCPTCHSTNIEKISTGKKIKGSLLFGVLSSDVRNTMHCKNCGAKW